jgi:Myosin head (motor domain)
MVVEQLRCAGVIEAIRISRAAFPNRLPFDEFIHRYGRLVSSSDNSSKAPQKTHRKSSATVTSAHTAVRPSAAVCRALMEKLMPGCGIQTATNFPPAYAVGTTRVYFRSGIVEELEQRRGAFIQGRVVLIQNLFATHVARTKYLRLRAGAVMAQKRWRIVAAQALLQQLKAEAAERARLEAIRLEQERLERERLARIAAAKAEAERLAAAAAAAAAAQAEQERVQRERAEIAAVAATEAAERKAAAAHAHARSCDYTSSAITNGSNSDDYQFKEKGSSAGRRGSTHSDGDSAECTDRFDSGTAACSPDTDALYNGTGKRFTAENGSTNGKAGAVGGTPTKNGRRNSDHRRADTDGSPLHCQVYTMHVDTALHIRCMYSMYNVVCTLVFHVLRINSYHTIYAFVIILY